MAQPSDGRQFQLYADLVVDAAGGLVGWQKRRHGVLAELQAAMPTGAEVSLTGTQFAVQTTDRETLERARAAADVVFLKHSITAPFRLSHWDEEIGAWQGEAPQPPEPVLISTMNEIPGYEVEEFIGEVYGLTVRARGTFPQLGANLKSIVGGELAGMTKLLSKSRDEVTERIIENARMRKANAIIAFRFDTSEIGGNWTEICAYGTAVRVRKMPPPAVDRLLTNHGSAADPQ